MSSWYLTITIVYRFRSARTHTSFVELVFFFFISLFILYSSRFSPSLSVTTTGHLSSRRDIYPSRWSRAVFYHVDRIITVMWTDTLYYYYIRIYYYIILKRSVYIMYRHRLLPPPWHDRFTPRPRCIYIYICIFCCVRTFPSRFRPAVVLRVTHGLPTRFFFFFLLHISYAPVRNRMSDGYGTTKDYYYYYNMMRDDRHIINIIEIRKATIFIFAIDLCLTYTYALGTWYL